jgi:hypothetical protein
MFHVEFFWAVVGYRHFRGPCCLHLQGETLVSNHSTTQHYNPQNLNLYILKLRVDSDQSWSENWTCWIVSYCSRQTPFANGASDSPGQILQRISEGRIDLESGNWVSVSTEAKVRHHYNSVCESYFIWKFCLTVVSDRLWDIYQLLFLLFLYIVRTSAG